MADAHFFEHQDAFAAWLEVNATASEVWVGFYKRTSGKQGLSWSHSVDVALRYGWIDGLRKTIDQERYRIRFTPRKASSVWSAVNVEKVNTLILQGMMKPEGLALFHSRQDRQGYRVTDRDIPLDKTYVDQFKARASTWHFFCQLAPSYKRESIWWVMSAKQDTTRQKRLEVLITSSEAGLKTPQLRKKQQGG